ncbi:MAG: MBL fold metallo-hydrolase [Thermodesulfobacteriota bacterium]
MIEVKDFQLGPIQTNCFLISKGSEAIVVDPGGDPQSVVKYIQDKGISLNYILNTHFHFDHMLGNRALQKATGATIIANPEDDALLQAQVEGGGGMMGFPPVEKFEYEPIHPGEHTFLGERCQVMATPGHSPGSLSFYFPDSGKIFSGDLIFPRAVGRTDLPGGSMETLMRSVKEKIFVLPGDTEIYSGHGPVTTVQEEIRFNPFFQ